MTMQDAPIHCPADVDATEVEQKACETPKPVKPGDGTVTPQGSGPTSPPPPPKKD